MYSLLAADIDDTLTDHEGSIHPDTARALKDLHRRGIPVVLSSGRSTASMRQVAVSLFGEDAPRYLIAFNGAHLWDRVEDRLLHSHDLTPRAVRVIIGYAREHNLYIQGFDDKTFVVERQTDYTRMYHGIMGLPFRVVDDLVEDREEGSPKLLIFGEHEVLLKHQRELSARSKGWRVTFSKPHLLEIVDPDVSKGAALSDLAQSIGIPLSAIVAVGDAPNDIEMVEIAGMGVAVGNAHPDLKVVADWVCTRSAGEGAVAELTKRFFS